MKESQSEFTEAESKSEQQQQQSMQKQKIPIELKRKIPKEKDKLDQILLEQYIMIRDVILLYSKINIFKQFDAILRIIEKQPKQYIEFSKLKYQDHVYQIGDSLLVSYYKNYQKVEQIGRLKRIISIKSFQDETQLPLIVMNWYCNKDDIPVQYKEYKQCFSVYELFLTDISTALLVDTIVHSCQVLSYDDYEKQNGSTDERIYFMRAAYNTFQENLVPHPREWNLSCICKVPPNPDLTYIFCEKCHEWIHLTCARMTQEEADKIQIYICRRCRN